MYIDLSVTLNEQTPVYPGDPATKISPAGVLARDGWCDHYISVGTHVGTHIDAPMHMVKDGKSIDKFPPEKFIGQSRLVDLSRGGFEQVLDINMSKGEIILFYSGMSKKYHLPGYFEKYPVMSTEVAEYIAKNNVKMIGLDACSVDNAVDFPIHKILLSKEVLIIENLTNLDLLIGKKFKIYALPVNLQLDGSPARVIAEIEN